MDRPDTSVALLADFYELTMAASYLRRSMTDHATFSLFARQLPPTRGFLVAAGLDSCLDFLETFHFDDQALDYMAREGFDLATLDAFHSLSFTGDVWAIPEGRVVFAGEPILEITAPIAEAQLVETYLLNQITFQTAVASKAARARIAARGRDLIDFSFRRTQGIEAGLAVARASAIAGFVATSNVEAARRYGLVASGTMAHSYVEAFPSEREAFRAFAADFPDRTTFLVDTYDTLDGVRNAIDTITSMRLSGRLAVRLDSGDLGVLAKETRQLLDQAGLTSVRILASGGLDEYRIDALVRDGAPIDALGVGTKMGVSDDAPYLDTAYKLVQYGSRPVMKLSPSKATAPGLKQVFRHPESYVDVVGLRDEPGYAGYHSLLEPVMIGGRRLDYDASVAAARDRFETDFARLPAQALALHDPVPPPVRLSADLTRLVDTTTDDVRRREEIGSGAGPSRSAL